jgi:hypothetical protein
MKSSKRAGPTSGRKTKALNGVDLFRSMEGKTSGEWGHLKLTFVQDNLSQEEIAESRRVRWRKNEIWKTPQGFSLVPDGRAGMIYFRQGQKLVALGAELAGSDYLDIVVFDDGFGRWIDVNSLECTVVTPEEQASIRKELIDWLTRKGLKFSIGGIVIARR